MRFWWVDELIWLNKDFARLHFDGVGFQVHTYRCALGVARGKIKPAVVLGTFDEVAHDKAVGEVNPLMGA